MKTIIIATIKTWNIKNAEKLAHTIKDKTNTKIITSKKELTIDTIKTLNPEYIFFPHWSWKIPEAIYANYPCIVFHMTDLPFGRGGSPLQNLIVRGYKQTKISAIKVVEAMDAGDVYLKEDLDLYGTADEIFMRASKIVFEKMIPQIL
ncbi:MAG TPA: methionyl-tRNA formyltransferase, partial [Thermotogota bacterium]|nr:methionyl-tRNA formyltransferase [Thermotogota bacterium]